MADPLAHGLSGAFTPQTTFTRAMIGGARIRPSTGTRSSTRSTVVNSRFGWASWDELGTVSRRLGARQPSGAGGGVNAALNNEQVIAAAGIHRAEMGEIDRIIAGWTVVG